MIATLLIVATMGCRGAEGPAGPPGPGSTLIAVEGTASLVVDDNTLGYAQIPGLSATVTIPANGAGEVLIGTGGGIQVNSNNPNAVCYTDVAVFVDGAQIGPERRTGTLNSTAVVYAVESFGFAVRTTLSPGAHTVAVKAKPFSAFAGVQCYVSSAAAGSGLPGNPRLQGVLNVIVFP